MLIGTGIYYFYPTILNDIRKEIIKRNTPKAIVEFSKDNMNKIICLIENLLYRYYEKDILFYQANYDLDNNYLTKLNLKFHTKDISFFNDKDLDMILSLINNLLHKEGLIILNYENSYGEFTDIFKIKDKNQDVIVISLTVFKDINSYTDLKRRYVPNNENHEVYDDDF